MPNLADLGSDTDSLGCSTELVIELQEEVQESFDEILESVNCEKVLNLSTDMFLNQDKETVVLWLVDALDTLRRSRNLLRDAAGEISVLQKEAIKDKSSIIQLQQEVIEENKKEIKAVQSTLQTEIKSYRDAVASQNSNKCDKEQITIDDVKEAVKSVTKDDARSRNLMVFGLEENEDLEAGLTKVFMQMDEKPLINHHAMCERLGQIATGSSSKPRPIKVTMSTSDSVEAVLKRSHLLRRDPSYTSVYIKPDRSPEERKAHKELVDALKVKISEEPEFYHFIRNSQIHSSPKRITTKGHQKEELSPPPPR